MALLLDPSSRRVMMMMMTTTRVATTTFDQASTDETIARLVHPRVLQRRDGWERTSERARVVAFSLLLLLLLRNFGLIICTQYKSKQKGEGITYCADGSSCKDTNYNKLLLLLLPPTDAFMTMQ